MLADDGLMSKRTIILCIVIKYNDALVCLFALTDFAITFVQQSSHFIELSNYEITLQFRNNHQTSTQIRQCCTHDG